MTTLLNNFIADKKKVFLALALSPLLLYLKSLFYDFSPMDEQWLIVNKITFLSDWGNIVQAFISPTGDIYYRPLLTLSFMINAAVGGLAPFSYHLLNVFLHIGCVFTLYRLLTLLSVENATSFLLSLLFAVHPSLLHAVAWVPGRNDSMLCLFILLSLIQLIHYLKENKKKFLIFHLLFFILALFTKENAALLPLVFGALLYAIGFDKKKLNDLVIVWIVFAVGWYFLKSEFVSFSLHAQKGFFVTFFITLKGIFIYIGKTLFPFSNSVAPTLKNASVLYGIITTFLLGVLFYKFGAANKKIALLGVLLFLIMISIPAWYGASSPIGEQYEHRIYVPLIGFIILVSQLKIENGIKIFQQTLMVLSLAFACFTFIRMDVYKNDLSYLKEGIKDCPENYLFHFYKANSLFKKGRLNEAVDCYSDALKLHPTRAQLLANRAEAYSLLGKKDEAIADFTKAFEKNSDPHILIGRFNCYKKFGDIPNAAKDLQLLKQNFGDNIGLSIDASDVKKWNEKRLNEMNSLIEKQPNSGILYVNRAKTYIDLRMGSKALADLKKACELEPNNEDFKRYYTELSSTFHGK